jgi:hypothetical protein
MLGRHERRLLEEIERQLGAQDPEFADRMTHTSPWIRVRAWLTGRRAIGVVAAFLAVLCLFLGEGAGFVMAGLFAGVVFLLSDWTIRTD